MSDRILCVERRVPPCVSKRSPRGEGGERCCHCKSNCGAARSAGRLRPEDVAGRGQDQVVAKSGPLGCEPTIVIRSDGRTDLIFS